MTTEVFLPFDGFYNSWIDAEINNVLECEADELGVERSDFDDYRVYFEAIARDYVGLYNATLREKLADKGKECYAVEFKFKGLISPRYYNFETDRILCTFEACPSLLFAVYRTLVGDFDSLQRDIEATFASRSGFASFCDDFVTAWKNRPITTWDSNELSVLLPHFGIEDFGDSEPTTFRESISDHVHFIADEENNNG